MAKMEKEWLKPVPIRESTEWDFSLMLPHPPKDPQMVKDFRTPNEVIWKCIRRLNKEADRSGPYHWMPVKMLKIERFLVAGMVYKIRVVLAESTTRKKDMGARDFGLAINPQVREGANRKVYEMKAWCQIGGAIKINDFGRLRDVHPEETFPSGYEVVPPGRIC